MKDAVRGLAEGKGDFAEYRKVLTEKFVLLNVYCKSVAEEHDPRGPDGPYQFKDRSVPVLVIKKWNGETLLQQLGFGGKGEQAMKRVSNWIDRASKDNGRIVPPKHIKPLAKAYQKALEHLEKGKPGTAWKELAKAVKGGEDAKLFPDGPPGVAREAKAKMDEILEGADDVVAQALELPTTKAKIALKKVLRQYKGVPGVKEKVDEALGELSP